MPTVSRPARSLSAGGVVVLGIALFILLALSAASLARVFWAPAAAPLPLPAVYGNSHLQAAAANLQRAVALQPALLDGYRRLAVVYRLADVPGGAAATWKLAAQANPDQVWPLAELGKLLIEEGDYAGALDAYRAAVAIAPDDRALQLAAARTARALDGQQVANRYLTDLALSTAITASMPSLTPVDQELADGWAFIGYAADEARLARDEETPLWLFWQAPGSEQVADESDEGWIALEAGVRVQHIPQSRNLVVAGGFEGSAAGGSVVGFPDDIYGADAATRRIAHQERRGLPTATAALANNAVDLNTSYASPWLPVDPDRLYLQLGWVRSATGNAFLGRRWSGGENPAEGATAPSYAISGEQAGYWRHAAQLAEPPPDATWAQVLLINFATSGEAFFDDVAFVQIGRQQSPPSS
jgi:Tfp pilus assembly protein PilF